MISYGILWGLIVGIFGTIFILPWIIRFIMWYYDKVLGVGGS